MNPESRLPRVWRSRALAMDSPVLALAQAVGTSPRIASLLWARGLGNPEDAHRFLHGTMADLPDPEGLPGVTMAAHRLADAVCKQETVGIHGDYDVDGVTSTVVLTEFLTQAGGRATWFIPDREKDGYGLSFRTVDVLCDRGIGVLLTCDNGTSAVAEVDRARARGVDVIICDHHTPGASLPQVLALLNPRVSDPQGPFADLAAVGVCFLLVVATRRELRKRGWFGEGRKEPNLKALMDVVALGTVADLAPLRGVNRLLVREGLKVLEQRRRPGLRALLEVSRTSSEEPLTASTLGFRLGPRINAAGRLDDAAPAVDLLLTGDESTAGRLAVDLDGINRRRQEIQDGTWSEVLAQVKAGGDLEGRRGLVLWSKEWHPGVVGIVAARVVEQFWKPAVLISVRDGVGRGSARTVPGTNLYGELRQCSDLLQRFGGHRAAAGLTVEESQLPLLKQRFERELWSAMSAEDRIPSLLTDGEMDPAEVGEALLGDLHLLQPFGLANPEPVFVVRGARVVSKKDIASGGLAISVEGGGGRIRAVGFGLGWTAAGLPERVDLAFSPQVNVFRGQRSIELRIRDLHLADARIPSTLSTP